MYFVEGDPLSPATLERAGLRTAGQLITLAPPGELDGAGVGGSGFGAWEATATNSGRGKDHRDGLAFEAFV